MMRTFVDVTCWSIRKLFLISLNGNDTTNHPYPCHHWNLRWNSQWIRWSRWWSYYRTCFGLLSWTFTAYRARNKSFCPVNASCNFGVNQLLEIRKCRMEIWTCDCSYVFNWRIYRFEIITETFPRIGEIDFRCFFGICFVSINLVWLFIYFIQ